MRRPLMLGLCWMLIPGVASAQPVPIEQARRDLINRAEHARGRSDHVVALDLGTRAGAIRMTPSLRLLLAQEHDALGHTLDALDHAQRCLHEAEAEETLRNRTAILAACTALHDALEARVGRLIVRAPSFSPGLRVRVDESELGEALWNVPIPMVPSTARVVAVAADGRRFEREVRIERGATEEVAIVWPSSSVPAVMSTRPTSRSEEHEAVMVTVPPSRIGVGPWILTGVAVAGFGAAAMLWGLHGAALNDRDAACDSTGCDPIARSLDERARSMTLGTNVLLGVGAAATVGAGLWFLLGRSRAGSQGEGLRRALIVPTQGGAFLSAEGWL